MTIRHRREALGITRQRLAELARCSIGSIAALEAGVKYERSRVTTQLETTLSALESKNAAPANDGDGVKEAAGHGPHDTE